MHITHQGFHHGEVYYSADDNMSAGDNVCAGLPTLFEIEHLQR